MVTRYAAGVWLVRDRQEIEVAVDHTGQAFTLDGKPIKLTDDEQEEVLKLGYLCPFCNPDEVNQ